MKRIFVTVLLLVFLTGCTGLDNYYDPEELCLVTSIGVLVENSKVVCFIEAPDFSSDNANENRVNKSSGDTFKQALQNASNLFVGKMLYSQCPIILIDDSVKNEVLEEIFELCLSEYDFSLSMRFINCDVSKTYSIIATKKPVGYDIFKLLINNERVNKTANIGKLSNILNSYKNNGEFNLIHLSIVEDSLVFDGYVQYKK